MSDRLIEKLLDTALALIQLRLSQGQGYAAPIPRPQRRVIVSGEQNEAEVPVNFPPQAQVRVVDPRRVQGPATGLSAALDDLQAYAQNQEP
jgi:hypothetical protein